MIMSLKKFLASVDQRYFLVLVVLLGLFFRTYGYGSFSLGFDQVQILENVAKIRAGDITLLGPRTGPASMFTGPLIYYLATFFSFFTGVMFSSIVTPIFLSAVTGITVYFLFKKYVGDKQAQIALFVWAVSPYLIRMDRIFWNPNISYVAFSLVFFPLLWLGKKSSGELDKKTELLSFALIFIGSFLTYQAHFSAFAVPFLVLMAVVYQRIKIKYFLSSCFGLMVSLIPTLLFDLRNSWLNLHGFLGLFASEDQIVMPNYRGILVKDVTVILEKMGRILLEYNNREFIILFGAFLFVTYLIKSCSQKERWNSFFPLLWTIAVVAGFSFYGGDKPEYYYFIALPALMYVLIDLIAVISMRQIRWIFVFFVVVMLSFVTRSYTKSDGMNFGNLLAVKEQVRVIQQTEGVSNIAYDVPKGTDFGLRYLFPENEFSNPNGVKVHVSYPNDRSYFKMTSAGNIGVWIDRRVEGKNYLVQKSFMVETEPQTRLYTDAYFDPRFFESDVYRVVTNGTEVGLLAVGVIDNPDSPIAQLCRERPDPEYNLAVRTDWTRIKLEDYWGEAYVFQNLCFYFEPLRGTDLVARNTIQLL